MKLNNYLSEIDNEKQVKNHKEYICLHGVDYTVKKLYEEIKKQRKIINLLRNKGIKYQTLYSWKTGHNPIPIQKLNELIILWQKEYKKDKKEIKQIWDKIYYENKGYSQNSQKKVTLPRELNNNLGYIIGFFQGDGHLKKETSQENSLYFYESDIKMIDKINKIIEKEFAIKGKIYECKNNKGHKWYTLRLCSKPIYLFFKNILKLKTGKKVRNVETPEIIKKSKLSIQLSFIKGFFDAEGTIGENKKGPWLEVGQASKDSPCEILIWIKNKLKYRDIFFSEPKRSKNQEFFRIRTSKRETIKRFFDKVSSYHPQKIDKFKKITKNA